MFVDPTSRTTSEAVNLHEVSRDFLDGVVYSAIVPQESVKGNGYSAIVPQESVNGNLYTHVTHDVHV